MSAADPKERARVYAVGVMKDLRVNCKGMDRDLYEACVQDELARAFFVGWAGAIEATSTGRVR